jgi:hypothetical protein
MVVDCALAVDVVRKCEEATSSNELSAPRRSWTEFLPSRFANVERGDFHEARTRKRNAPKIDRRSREFDHRDDRRNSFQHATLHRLSWVRLYVHDSVREFHAELLPQIPVHGRTREPSLVDASPSFRHLNHSCCASLLRLLESRRSALIAQPPVSARRLRNRQGDSRRCWNAPAGWTEMW